MASITHGEPPEGWHWVEFLKLRWYGTVSKIPSSNVFDEEATDVHEEIYADKLTNKRLSDGFLPWTDTFDIDEFYQYPIDSKFVKKNAKGWTLNKMKRALIRKHKPFHQL